MGAESLVRGARRDARVLDVEGGRTDALEESVRVVGDTLYAAGTNMLQYAPSASEGCGLEGAEDDDVVGFSGATCICVYGSYRVCCGTDGSCGCDESRGRENAEVISASAACLSGVTVAGVVGNRIRYVLLRLRMKAKPRRRRT